MFDLAKKETYLGFRRVQDEVDASYESVREKILRGTAADRLAISAIKTDLRQELVRKLSNPCERTPFGRSQITRNRSLSEQQHSRQPSTPHSRLEESKPQSNRAFDDLHSVVALKLGMARLKELTQATDSNRAEQIDQMLCVFIKSVLDSTIEDIEHRIDCACAEGVSQIDKGIANVGVPKSMSGSSGLKL